MEAGIPELQAALRDGRTTSRQIVTQYLIRMAIYENALNATLAVNPDALTAADVLDRERVAGRLRGPLHGISVAMKDNIQTTNMPTTAGTLRFTGWTPPYEATVTRQMREAGAIIIAKTVLTEMANWMVINMPNNYSSVGGYAFNPYDPRRDPRPGFDDGRGVLVTGSSSSGSGTAMSLWAANSGTETTVSIIGPETLCASGPQLNLFAGLLVVFLAVDLAALLVGFALQFGPFFGGHFTVGLGLLFVAAQLSLAMLETGSFFAGQFARLHAVLDALFLNGLALVQCRSFRRKRLAQHEGGQC